MGHRLLTAREAETLLPVTRHLVYAWRADGRIKPAGKRGRSPLYRWADLVAAERNTRVSGKSHRGQRAA